MGARYVDADVLVRDGLGDEHVVLCHDDAVTSIEDFVHGLEEVVRLVEVDALLPSLTGLLVALEVWVVRDEDAGLGLLLADFAEAKSDALRLLGDTPSEVEDVALHELPGLAEVLCHVQLLVDLARLVIVEVSARRPSRSEGPLPLVGMEVEFVDLLARVEGSQVGATILCDPINTVGACEYDQTVVDWTLQHSLNVTDVSLTIIEHVHARLMHIGVQLLPRVSSIS